MKTFNQICFGFFAKSLRPCEFAVKILNRQDTKTHLRPDLSGLRTGRRKGMAKSEDNFDLAISRNIFLVTPEGMR